MNGTFKAQLGILPAEQRKLWPALRRTGELGFVLYGGTAIALRLGHRVSVDFDFFCDLPLDRDALCAALPFLSQAVALQDQGNTWVLQAPTATAHEPTVKLSFFGTIGFGRVGQPDLTDDGVLYVASLADLMATKLKVILQRAEAKDYRDIAAMLMAGVSLPHGLAHARLLFGPNFQPSESLKALVYFNDGDLHTLTPAEKTTLVRAAKAVRALPDVSLRSQRLLERG